MSFLSLGAQTVHTHTHTLLRHLIIFIYYLHALKQAIIEKNRKQNNEQKHFFKKNVSLQHLSSSSSKPSGSGKPSIWARSLKASQLVLIVTKNNNKASESYTKLLPSAPPPQKKKTPKHATIFLLALLFRPFLGVPRLIGPLVGRIGLPGGAGLCGSKRKRYLLEGLRKPP